MDDLHRRQGDDDRLLTALLIEALQHREKRGQETTLRDLHELMQTSQPIALRIAHRLEEEGILKVERSLTDAFASLVKVAPPVASRLLYNDKKAKRTAR